MEFKFDNARAIRSSADKLLRFAGDALRARMRSSEEDALAHAYPRVTNSQDEFARSTVGPAFYLLPLLLTGAL